MKRPCSLVLLLLVLGSGGSMHAGSKDTQQSSLIGGKSIEYILERLGARMEHDLSFEQHQRYVQHFDFVDTDHNGRLTVQEFVENGTYRTPQARQGIFRASDENGDGTVTMDEYVINRVITDEAKSLLNAMEALVDGIFKGSKLVISVAVTLIVAIALVALVNEALDLLPDVKGRPLSLHRMLGWAMAPVAWLIGVPWSEAALAGQLIGVKVVLNELVAYLDMAALPPDALSAESRLALTYALCGFANLGSLGILLGGLSAMVPERRADILALGPKSLLSGNLACFMTGAVVTLTA